MNYFWQFIAILAGAVVASGLGGVAGSMISLRVQGVRLRRVEEDIKDLKSAISEGVLPEAKIMLQNTKDRLDSHESRICSIEGSPFCVGHQMFSDSMKRIDDSLAHIDDRLYQLLFKTRGGHESILG